MTSEEKKNLIRKTVDELGGKKSWYQVAADLELKLWTIRHKGQEWWDAKFKR